MMEAKWNRMIEAERRGWLELGGVSDTEADVFSGYSWQAIPDRAKTAFRKAINKRTEP